MGCGEDSAAGSNSLWGRSLGGLRRRPAPLQFDRHRFRGDPDRSMGRTQKTVCRAAPALFDLCMGVVFWALVDPNMRAQRVGQKRALGGIDVVLAAV